MHTLLNVLRHIASFCVIACLIFSSAWAVLQPVPSPTSAITTLTVANLTGEKPIDQLSSFFSSPLTFSYNVTSFSSGCSADSDTVLRTSSLSKAMTPPFYCFE